MAEAKLVSQTGEEKGRVTLSADLFERRPHKDAMHEAVRSYLDNQRQGTHSTLTRSEVDASGKKPWRQKGTGRARSGTRGSPVWRGGGIIFGPRPRDYSHHLPRKMRRLAVVSALTAQAQNGAIVVLESLSLEEAKTKRMVEVMKNIAVHDRKTLFVLAGYDEGIARAAGNLPRVRVRVAREVTAYDILDCERLVVLKDALTALEERCS